MNMQRQYQPTMRCESPPPQLVSFQRMSLSPPPPPKACNRKRLSLQPNNSESDNADCTIKKFIGFLPPPPFSTTTSTSSAPSRMCRHQEQRSTKTEMIQHTKPEKRRRWTAEAKFTTKSKYTKDLKYALYSSQQPILLPFTNTGTPTIINDEAPRPTNKRSLESLSIDDSVRKVAHKNPTELVQPGYKYFMAKSA